MSGGSRAGTRTGLGPLHRHVGVQVHNYRWTAASMSLQGTATSLRVFSASVIALCRFQSKICEKIHYRELLRTFVPYKRMPQFVTLTPNWRRHFAFWEISSFFRHFRAQVLCAVTRRHEANVGIWQIKSFDLKQPRCVPVIGAIKKRLIRTD